MVGGLLLGFILSVSHHLYYRSIDQVVITSITDQTWALRIGSTFAIAVRICLSTSLGTSIIQLFWRIFRDPQRSVSLSTVDKLFAITSQPLGFLSYRAWRYSPVLVSLGVISW
jgi:hypothetical protein